MSLHPRGRKTDGSTTSGRRTALAGIVAAALVAGGTAASAPAKSSHALTAPPLMLQGNDVLTGTPVSLSRFAGKPVIVNLWSSTCGACFADARALAGFEQTHPAARVVGVDVTDSTSGARNLIRRAAWHHPSIADPSGRIAAQLQVLTLPTTLFLNAHHLVVERINGQTNLAGFSAGYRKATA